MILLDTNVISELMKVKPQAAVSAWMDKQPEDALFTASVVLAELFAGIAMMPAGRKKELLREAIEGMIVEDFRGRIMPFDLRAAREYGRILAARRKLGRPIREFDAQIAAIASVQGATLATRNVRDFERCGVTIIDPWSAEPGEREAKR